MSAAQPDTPLREVGEPPSRRGAHVLGAVVGLVLAPPAIVSLAHGAQELMASPAGEVPLGGWPWLVLGAVLLAGIAATAAFASSLALVVAGLWAFFPGLVGGALTRPLLTAPAPLELRSAVSVLAFSGVLLAVGAALLGAALGVHLARRAGRHQEQADAAPEPTVLDQDDETAASPPPPLPPPSRMWAHVLVAVFSLALSPATIILLGRAADRLSLELGVQGGGQPWQEPSLLLACALLVLVLALVGMSSLGAQLAGWLMYLLPVVVAALAIAGQHWALNVMLSLDSAVGVVAMLGTGGLAILGLVLVLGGGAGHFARRTGRRLERALRAVPVAG
ncbi:hypothetical protein [Georgenia yuyongxinii]|uniref:hypothetical protein n=1 Tax=Georgenia yuyongxinii TaxID=2589797 RepID=UPI00163D9AB3|nr:hypothetical protein [Georgenia yuyongxinii]